MSLQRMFRRNQIDIGGHQSNDPYGRPPDYSSGFHSLGMESSPERVLAVLVTVGRHSTSLSNGFN
jgi:hypothetical protein